MLLKEAISERIIELCNTNNITPNKLAELSSIPSTNMKDLINKRINNPSTVIIYKICRTLNLEIKDFFDSELFKNEFYD